MFLLIDNYDSFTYNLVQAFATLGREATVVKNDDPILLDLASDSSVSMVCISPGPGRPEEAGLCLEFLKRLDKRTPVLGVCLGHQILATFADAKVIVAPQIMHGKQSEIEHSGDGLFNGILKPMLIGRYHSLIVEDKTNPLFDVTARSQNGEIMALQYRDRPWAGVQFHPESVLTPDGLRLLSNFPSGVLTREALGADLRTILTRLTNRQDLTEDMAAIAFSELMDGKLTNAQAAALLMGLHIKGESAIEMAQAMRCALARAVKVQGLPTPCLDIVGTGGDGHKSFNCSTISALILAGMGYKIAKHGNRAVSSTSGSADVLEGLGITLESDPKTAVEMVEKRNFAFLFAPYFHPAFKNIGPLRREMDIPTLFNILGPMINPANTSHLLLGVAKKEMVDLVAQTMTHSSLYRIAVVCGAGNYDEVTPMGVADIVLIHNGQMQKMTLNPAEFDIPPCDEADLVVNNKEEAVAVAKTLLKGEGNKAMLDMLILNVGLAIYLVEENLAMAVCMAKAREAVMTGVGRKVLHATT